MSTPEAALECGAVLWVLMACGFENEYVCSRLVFCVDFVFGAKKIYGSKYAT